MTLPLVGRRVPYPPPGVRPRLQAVRVMLVTDPAFGDDDIVRRIEQVARVVPAGSLCVQLRDKVRASASLRMFAWRLRTVTRALGVSLIVNGHVEDALRVARDVGADGVHLGAGGPSIGRAREWIGRAWISLAVHADEDVIRAVGAGADAVVVSPIFDSRPPGEGRRKNGRGVAALRSARALAGRVPVFALGGVDASNARACSEAGAHGVAVMKALLAGGSPARAARAIHDAVAPRW